MNPAASICRTSTEINGQLVFVAAGIPARRAQRTVPVASFFSLPLVGDFSCEGNKRKAGISPLGRGQRLFKYSDGDFSGGQVKIRVLRDCGEANALFAYDHPCALDSGDQSLRNGKVDCRKDHLAPVNLKAVQFPRQFQACRLDLVRLRAGIGPRTETSKLFLKCPPSRPVESGPVFVSVLFLVGLLLSPTVRDSEPKVERAQRTGLAQATPVGLAPESRGKQQRKRRRLSPLLRSPLGPIGGATPRSACETGRRRSPAGFRTCKRCRGWENCRGQGRRRTAPWAAS